MKKCPTMKKTGYRCRKCGYRWVPRTNRVPKECPRCKNRGWRTGAGWRAPK